MEDVQARPDDRGIAIDFAGITGLRYPATVPLRDGGKQEAPCTISLAAGVLHTDKGTHMSRFLEALHDHAADLAPAHARPLLDDLCQRLDIDRVRLDVSHELFLTRHAPVTGAPSLLAYPTSFTAWLAGGEFGLTQRVEVLVTTLCPCSRDISDRGAHNQRSRVTIEVAGNSQSEDAWTWPEDLIEVAEGAGSAPIYAVLKRPDERFVTMQAYDNPVFVEDVVRDVAGHLDAAGRFEWYRVRVESDESIHQHNAFAELERGIRPSSASTVS